MWIKIIATIALLAIGMAMAAPQYNSESDLLAESFANSSDVDFYNTSAKSNRVINGSPAQRCQLPWHVIININRGAGRLCGGSLISSSFVLTEANALRGAGSFDCILGAHFSGDRRVVRRSTHAILHPKHKPGSGNYNIALLRLDRAFTDFSKLIHPVLLPAAMSPDAEESPYEGRHAWISGFGSTTGSQFVTNQWSTVRVLTNETCMQTFPGVFGNIICTVGHDGYHSGPGIGDGGAPLVALEHGRYFQIGVYAFSWYHDFTRPVGYISTFDPEIRNWIRHETTI